ncbi:MAG TPA: transglycosylase domain-containing protein [Dehalococcoidia bacterium]|nr:transglycosylase domain-containing protein [Dehalococcoidia bacterium]
MTASGPVLPSEAHVFVARLDELAEHGRTLGFLLQSCILRLDSMLAPRERPSPTDPLRTTAAPILRARRDRRQQAALVESRRGLAGGLALTLLAPAALLFAGFAAFEVYDSYVSGLVPPEQLAINQASRGARIYDRNGELLYEFVSEQDGVRLPVKLADISPAFLAATIATEDHSFFENPGVNPRGLARAAWENVRPLLNGSEVQLLRGSGGSSITQQLIKNIYIPAAKRDDRSFERKLREAAYALELTQRYDKTQILEWYVNQISYGGRYNGVEAASQGYFGKSAMDLTLAESALLAGIPQSPARHDPLSRPDAAMSRRSEILNLIAQRGTVQIGESTFFTAAPDEIEAATQAPLGVQPRSFPIEAPHFVLNHVAPELEAMLGREALYRDGLIVKTTLDMNLQRQASELLERWIREFEDISNSRNGALVVVDARSGELTSLIGSRDYFREDIQGNVDNLTALNSPGSSFKPFVYLASFMKLGWNPQTVIEDTPVTFQEANGRAFQPQNPSRGTYLGPIAIAKALGNSLNVPAFKTALRLGVPSIVEVARQAGFTTLNGYYGPAIAIGGVDLTAMDLTYAYSVLANNGLMVGQHVVQPHGSSERTLDPISILRVEDSAGKVVYDVDQRRARRQVVPAAKAYEVTSILSDPSNQCLTFGCGGISIPGRPAAVKTGTSEPFEPAGPNAGKIGETWAFGYTPDYVVGVWAGNSDNTPIVNIYSTSISFRVMRDTLQAAYAGNPSGPFVKPAAPSEERQAQAPAKTPTQRPSNVIPRQVRGAAATPRATIQARPSPIAPRPPEGAKATVTSVTPTGAGYSITGTAYSEAMQSYRVEVTTPTESGWRAVLHGYAAVTAGKLGEWSTEGVVAGIYNLRVVVQDEFQGTIASPSMRVSVVPH